MKKRVVVIGAGIVGLATAYHLKRKRPELDLIVVDKENGVAAHQTSHNSGVIHSGIYYKPGSLKALNCKKGYDMLLEFCREHGIRHEITGKIIAAADASEHGLLDQIFERGRQNGLAGIAKISAEAAREIEPNVRCSAAVWVPQTGIIDYPDVANVYRGILEAQDTRFVYGAKTTQINRNSDQTHTVVTTAGAFTAELVVNCAGLYADDIARMTNPEFQGQVIPFRGEYYQFKPESEGLVRNLIYPVPNPNFPFLGVHFTRMARGGVEAGPNAVLAYAREGYHRSQFNWPELTRLLRFSGFHKIAARYWRDGWAEFKRSYSKAAFVSALQRLVPDVTAADLVEGGAGVRAQICMPDGSLVDDFLVLRRPGVVHVVNAPSPAATASLAVGEHVAEVGIDVIL